MDRRTVTALVAVYVIWGSTYLAIKYMVIGFPPMIGTGIRFLIAGAILYLVAARRGNGLTGRQWWAAAQLGALLIVGGTGMVTVAESTGIGSGLAATAVAAMPLWAGVIAGVFGRWPTHREWWGLGMGMAGVGLLGLESDFSTNPIGAVILFVAPASWALGSILRTRSDLPDGTIGVAAEMLSGGALLTMIGTIGGERFDAAPPLEAWLGLAYLTVFGSIIAFSAYMYLLGAARPPLATSYAYVNPVVAVILGLTVGAETLTGEGLVALPLILGGVALITRNPTRVSRLLPRHRQPVARTAPTRSGF